MNKHPINAFWSSFHSYKNVDKYVAAFNYFEKVVEVHMYAFAECILTQKQTIKMSERLIKDL